MWGNLGRLMRRSDWELALGLQAVGALELGKLGLTTRNLPGQEPWQLVETIHGQQGQDASRRRVPKPSLSARAWELFEAPDPEGGVDIQ